MNEVSPYPLWIGHAGDGRNFKEIFAKRIRVVVQLAMEEPALTAPRELIYLRYPLKDGQGNQPGLLPLAIGAVAKLMEQKIPTLVCCGAGMSRSLVIVAAALSVVRSEDFADCLKQLVVGRPADVAPALFMDVRSALAQNRRSDETEAGQSDQDQSELPSPAGD